MQIGKPQREVIVEPLELPEPLRTEPSFEPQHEEQPVEVPAGE